MTQAANLAALGSSGVSLGMKNRIINGAMVIDQRYSGASLTNNTAWQYCIDRWQIYGSVGSKFTCQQNAGSVTPPVGFKNYAGITSSSAYSITTSDQFLFRTVFEGLNTYDLAWGTSDAKTVTLSFWVRSSLTGNFGGAVKSTAGPTRSYAFSYTISAANTWTQISVTVPGCTDGSWATDNTASLQIWFNIAGGSNFLTTGGSWVAGDYQGVNGATSVVGTSGATWYITGVQLEVGTTATNFDYRSYGTELALCQRYFQIVPFTGIAANTSELGLCAPFKVTMRANPSVNTVLRRGPDYTQLPDNQIDNWGVAVFNTSGVAFSAGFQGTNALMQMGISSVVAGRIYGGSTQVSAEL